MVFAQQDPQYTNFLFNNFAINPAVAGLNECLDVRGGYRQQWVGFEGNPRTIFIHANSRVNSWSTRDVFHGVGGFVESDITGPSSRLSIYGSYSLHLKISRKTKAAFGVHFGGVQYRLDASQLRPGDPTDPAIGGSVSSIAAPDITPGIWVYGKDWYTGFSVRHIVEQQIENLGEESALIPHYSLIAGTVFGDEEQISYIPAIMAKFTRNTKPAVDVNFWADYKNTVAVGVAYRNEDAVAGMLKVNFLKYFTLTYAYDYTLSEIQTGASNTHEVMLGFLACPQNLRQGFVPCAAYD